MNASALNPLYEMMFGSSSGCVSASSCFGWLSSARFHRNLKSVATLSLFNLGSLFTDAVRWASDAVVVQGGSSPRPCASTPGVPVNAAAIDSTAMRVIMLSMTPHCSDRVVMWRAFDRAKRTTDYTDCTDRTDQNDSTITVGTIRAG